MGAPGADSRAGSRAGAGSSVLVHLPHSLQQEIVLFNSFLILHRERGIDLSVAYTQFPTCINHDRLVEGKRTTRLVLTASPAPGWPLSSGPQQEPVSWLLCRHNHISLILVTATRLLIKIRVCCLPRKQTQPSPLLSESSHPAVPRCLRARCHGSQIAIVKSY